MLWENCKTASSRQRKKPQPPQNPRWLGYLFVCFWGMQKKFFFRKKAVKGRKIFLLW